jgi:hypothetical protein
LIEDPDLEAELEAIQPIMANAFADDGEDNDGDIIAGPTVEAHVYLAKTASMYFLIIILTTTHNTAASRIHPNDLAADID